MASSTLALSDSLLVVNGDIGRPDTGTKLVNAAVGKFGSVDLLVNNAGIFISKPFTEYTREDFQRLVSTNLAGFSHVSQPVVAQMQRQQSGPIVNISTTLADQPIAGVPAAIPILTKGGLNAVTRALAIEYAPQNTRVNAIAAGIIDTPMHPTLWGI